MQIANLTRRMQRYSSNAKQNKRTCAMVLKNPCLNAYEYKRVTLYVIVYEQRAVKIKFQTTLHIWKVDTMCYLLFYQTVARSLYICVCVCCTYFDVWNNDGWQHAINVRAIKKIRIHTCRTAVILNWLYLTCDHFRHAMRAAAHCMYIYKCAYID